eukprot:PhF_6_TR37666/c0_g1_i1/m.56050
MSLLIVVFIVLGCVTTPALSDDKKYRTAELYTMINEQLDILSQKATACGCPTSAVNINPPETVEDGDEVIAGILHHAGEDMYEAYQDMMKECECIHDEAGATNTLLHLYRFEKPSVKVTQTEVERDFHSIIDALTESVGKCCITKKNDAEHES